MPLTDPVSFATNDFDSNSLEGVDPDDVFSFQTQRNAAAEFGDKSTAVSDFVRGASQAVPALLAASADTLLSSIGVIDDDAVETYLDRNAPEVGEFLAAHDSVRIVSDIATAFIPGTLAIKSIRAGSMLAKATVKVFGAGSQRLFSTGKNNTKLFKEYLHRDVRTLAKNRSLGSDIRQIPGYKQARSTRLKDSVKENVAADLAIAASMNESDFLFPDEFTITDHLMFFGVTNALFGLGARAASGYALKKRANKLTGKIKVKQGALSGLDEVAGASASGARGVAALVLVEELKSTKLAITEADAAGNRELVGNLRQQATALEVAIKDEVVAMAADNPVRVITQKHSLSSAEVKTMQIQADENAADSLAAIVSLEAIDDPAIKILQIAEQRIKTEAQIAKGLAILASGRARNPKRTKEEMEKSVARLEQLNQAEVFIYESSGELSIGAQRRVRFQDGDRTIVTGRNGETTARVDGSNLTLREDGSVVVPKEVVADDFGDAALDVVSLAEAGGGKAGIKELGMKGEKELIANVKSGAVAGILTIPARLKALREKLGNRSVTLYRVPGTQEPLFAASREGKFTEAVTVDSEAVWGVTGKGRIIAESFDNVALTNETYLSMPYKQKTAVMDLFQQRAERIAASTKGEQIEVQAGQHFLYYDSLLRAAELNPAIARRIKGVNDLDELRMLSLDAKFQAFQLGRKREVQRFKKGTPGENSLRELGEELNLPADHQMVQEVFEAMTSGGALVSLRDFARTTKELTERIANQGARTHTQGAEVVDDFKFNGRALEQARDRKPVMAIMRDLDPADRISRTQLNEAQAIQRGEFMARFEREAFAGDGKSATNLLLQSVLGPVKALPDLFEAIGANLKGLVHGFDANGQFTEAFVSQAFRYRLSPAVIAMQRMTTEMEKGLDRAVALIQETPLVKGGRKPTEIFADMAKPSNAGSSVLLLQMRQALRNGWDVERAPMAMHGSSLAEKGQFTLVLKDSQRNKEIWDRLAKTNPDMKGFPEKGNRFLPHPSQANMPMVFDALTLEAAQAITGMSRKVGEAMNAQLRINGAQVHPLKDWHFPADNLEGKFTTYVATTDGHIIGQIPGRTNAESLRLAAEDVAKRNANGENVILVPRSSVNAYFEARVEQFITLKDFSRATDQTARSAGRAASPNVNTSADIIGEMLASVTRGYKDVGRQARIKMFEPHLNYARREKLAAGLDGVDTTYDGFVRALVGSQDLTADTVITKSLLFTETLYDQIMRSVFDLGIGQKLGGRFITTRRQDREFAQINRSIAKEYQPFTKAQDFFESTTKTRMPNKLRSNAAAMNEITTALTIRVLDVGMGMINMLSLGATLPVVVHGLRPLRDEIAGSVEHLQRIGVYADVSPAGIAALSPVKTAITGVHRFYKALRNPKSPDGLILKEAERRGYLNQSAAEQVAEFSEFGQSFLVGKARKAGDFLSQITDITERHSRSVSFMTFYNIGSDVLGLDKRASMAFAHQQANNVIADFRPSNRPTLFQGAAGMPMGLFTTYMWNYLQRFYNLAETGNKSGLMLQAGLQASLFGGETLPGWDLYVQHATANYDGDRNIVDRLNDGLGHEAASVFLNGTLSSIPKLFGAETGISIGPRAAVGLPGMNGLFSPDSVAGLRLGVRLVQTGAAVVDSAIQEGGIDGAQAASIVARMRVHKGLSNYIEYQQGFSEDSVGGLTERDTTSTMSVVSRALGFKPLYADESRQENIRNRMTDKYRQSLKARLSTSLRQKIRLGTLTDEDLEQDLDDYVRAGGDAANFTEFFNGTMLRATNSKTDMALAQSIKRSSENNRMARLLFLQGQDPESGEIFRSTTERE